MQEDAGSWAVKVGAGVIGVLLLGAFLVEIERYQSLGGNGSGEPCVSTSPTMVASNSTFTPAPAGTATLPNSPVPQNSTGPPVPLHNSPLPSTEDLDLAVLADLPISGTSRAVTELANSTFWQEVMSAWNDGILGIAPQTYIGFLNSSKDWQSWAYENIPNPPGWLSVGFIPYFRVQVFNLGANGASQDGTGLVGLANIKRYVASVSGTSLAALDFITFNTLTALRTYFETGDASLAICQTFPAQLATLYIEAFDANVPSDLRTQYLGRALAITTFMVALGGAKDGFGAKFQVVVDGAGLGDAWHTVEPYLAEIGEKVSGAASTATFSILQTLPARFPQDSVWVTGLTAFRVESMVEVLKDDGLPNDLVQNDIQKVAQAASNPQGEDGPAGIADESS